MSEITLTIDGQQVKSEMGDTVLVAAQKAGIKIPTLCAHPALEPYGSCRLCIVRIENVRGNPTACTTPATEGMIVDTKHPEVVETRKEILKLLMTSHTSPCLVCYHRIPCEKYRPQPFKTGKATRCTFCSARDDCELRTLAFEHEITELDMPIIYKNHKLERSDPFMDRNYNLCVLCGRCARICKKIHDKGAIEFTNRGHDARMGTAFGRPHTDTNCVFCGACIQICPVGALTDRFAKWHGAAEQKAESSCILCPHGCTIEVGIKNGIAIETGMPELSKEGAICAVGRFANTQILHNSMRLKYSRMEIEDGMIRCSRDEALAKAAEILKGVSGTDFALIAQTAAPREELAILKKFTTDVMKSENFAVASESAGAIKIEPASVADAINSGKVKVVFTTGDFVSPDSAAKLDALIVSDLFPSESAHSAKVVFASAGLMETGGTIKNCDGTVKNLAAVSTPLDESAADWKTICDIATIMGAKDLSFGSLEDAGKKLKSLVDAVATPAKPEPSPLETMDALPRYFRGHEIKTIVPPFDKIIDKSCCLNTDEVQDIPADDSIAFRVVENVEIVPNTHMITVYAPQVVEKLEAGNFVIAMVDEKSERTPYSVADFDKEKGTITMVTMEVGRSSREISNVAPGSHLAHFAGPLGAAIELKNYGTVVVAGGCYGVGAILPVARALKKAGNKVIVVEEASSHYLLHWEDKLAAAGDEFIIVTKDGSKGMKGGIQEVIAKLVARGEKIDQAFLIGCTFMMMMVSRVNKEFGIPTLTAMNPIMLDGTGMCGVCRVTVGSNTKFACVDGPFLDGLEVDWEELFTRKSTFKRQEVDALPQQPCEDSVHNKHCICSAT